MGVKIKAGKQRDIHLLHVGGRASSGDVLKVSKKLEALMRKTASFTVLDLSEMAFLDSNWMGVLIASWKHYRETGKELVFLIPEGFIRELFHNAGLDRVFRLITSLDELHGGTATNRS